MKLRYALAGLILLPLAGCSGSSTGIPSVYDAADAIGATNVQPYAAGPMASAYAHARWHGHRITIATFATPDLENQWLNLAGTATTVVARGNLYAAVEIPGQ